MSSETRVKVFPHIKQDLVVLDFFSEEPAFAKKGSATYHTMITAAVRNEDLKETSR
jgi:hypothetical protein